MAGNARRGPHCIGIVFLCQEWRLWGLFFAGRDFAVKSMLPLIRQNVFLAVSHSPFLELLTLQKGPIAPFSATTPLFGRNGRFEGARRRCACSSPAVCPWSLGSVARRFPLALAPFRPRSVFRRLLRALAISLYRRMSNLRAPPAALTPLKHTLHFAVTCVSRS